MQRQTTQLWHSGQASHCLPTAVRTHPGGSCFQTPWSLHHHARSIWENARELFFPSPAGGVIACPGLAAPSQPPQQQYLQQQQTASEDRPLTSPPPRSALTGCPVESLAAPLGPTGSSRMVYCTTWWCTPCYLYSQQPTCTVYIALCIQ
jgi:hypothetical protein